MITQSLVPLGTAVHQLIGRNVAPATLWRWHRKGIAGVKLNVTRLGGRVYVRPGDLGEFMRAITAAAAGGQVAAPEAARPEATSRRLAAAGLI